LELRINKVQQAASGGSHVTIFEADVEFVRGEADVLVHGTEPGDAVPGYYREATEAIRRGAEQVLKPLSLGAIIRIGRIVLHPVDFKPSKFERYTVEELRYLVEQWLA
jgi:hypothetical protein